VVNPSWKEHEVTCVNHESDPLVGGILYQVQRQPGKKQLQELTVVDELTVNVKEATSL
jgi:hypothetical protein